MIVWFTNCIQLLHCCLLLYFLYFKFCISSFKFCISSWLCGFATAPLAHCCLCPSFRTSEAFTWKWECKLSEFWQFALQQILTMSSESEIEIWFQIQILLTLASHSFVPLFRAKVVVMTPVHIEIPALSSWQGRRWKCNKRSYTFVRGDDNVYNHLGCHLNSQGWQWKGLLRCSESSYCLCLSVNLVGSTSD